MTSNDTDYHAFYFDGKQRTAIWTSSPDKNAAVLAVPQGGTGQTPGYTGMWNAYKNYNARPAPYG